MKTLLFSYKFLFMSLMSLPLALCSDDNNINEPDPTEQNPDNGENTETDVCDNKPNIRVERLGSDIIEPFSNSGFGYSIALSGDGRRLVVGSPFADTIGNSAGKVSVYEFKDGIWQKMGNDIYGREDNHNAGLKVAINKQGNIIGTVGDVCSIYQFDGVNWIQLGGNITTPDGETGSNTGGLSINYSGLRIAVGAQTYQPTNGLKRGGVRIYEFSEGEWKRVGKTLWIEDCRNCQFAGGNHQVSLSGDGNRVALGVSYRPPNSVRYSRVGIFEYSNSKWNLIGSKGGSGTAENSRVSLNSDGTKMTRSTLANGWTGNIELFDISSEINIIDTDYSSSGTSFFGLSHSISGDGKRFIVHEPVVNVNDGIKNGVTRLYFQIEDKICQVTNPIASNSDINNEFTGTFSFGDVSMSSDGKRFAVSSPKIMNNKYDGIVEVYEIVEE